MASLLAAIGLALIHLIAGKLRFLEGTPRSRWLSIAGGVSVAYVFLRLLPELNEGQEALSEALEGTPGFLESHVYLIALIGLAVFYGLDRLALRSREQTPGEGEDDKASPGVFWLHIGSFALYNAIIGYLLLHREQPGVSALLLFFVAMALHFLVNDYGLREHHKDDYDRWGRWVLAAAVLVGWLVGLVTEISEAAIAILIACIAGGVILNVLKEELPAERASRFGAFALGAGIYAAILLAL